MVLVTGAAGYIGSHCIKALLARGYEVVAFDNLSRGHRDAVTTDCFFLGDLLDRVALRRVFEAFPIDSVVHLAGLICVGESMDEPMLYYRNNVVGTINLLSEMLERGVTRLVFSSSAAVYGDPTEIPMRESHPKSPTSVYGRTKLIAEQVMEDLARCQKLRYTALRYFNAAGCDVDGQLGEQHAPETHLIPIILAAAQHPDRAVTVFGTDYPTPDGTCIRDYVHVDDLARAHVAALQLLADGHAGGAYNLGLMQGFSVREVVDVCGRVAGRSISVVEGPRRAGDPPVLVADSTRARAELHWRPQVTWLEEIVRSAWEWSQLHNPQ